MRKGTSYMLLIMVLLVVVLLSFLLFMQNIRDVVNAPQEEAYCSGQVLAHAKIGEFTDGNAAPTITCPTARIEETVTEDQAKRLIANEMARCWKIWGEGKYQLFGKEEGMYCHVCSTIKLDGIEKVSGLPAYLDNTEYDEGLKYSQYLAGTKEGTFFTSAAFAQQAAYELGTDKPVAVIFTYTKGLPWHKKLQETLKPTPAKSAGAGIVGGIAIGVGVTVAAGFSWPVIAVGAVTAAAVGGTGGLSLGVWGTPDAEYMSLVVVKPMDDSIQNMGCQIDPVN